MALGGDAGETAVEERAQSEATSHHIASDERRTVLLKLHFRDLTPAQVSEQVFATTNVTITCVWHISNPVIYPRYIYSSSVETVTERVCLRLSPAERGRAAGKIVTLTGLLTAMAQNKQASGGDKKNSLANL